MSSMINRYAINPRHEDSSHQINLSILNPQRYLKRNPDTQVNACIVGKQEKHTRSRTHIHLHFGAPDDPSTHKQLYPKNNAQIFFKDAIIQFRNKIAADKQKFK
uniref:Uncharacterized protein n=1 Tax=Opuntia streptacantha TaxID=393608 RepID=A0A7C9EQE2_OPUST